VIKLNGYEKRTIAKKEAIINAARDLFFARGIQDVSINEIAKLAHVSQVSIYNYFGDKKSLAKEAFISLIGTAIYDFDQILESDIPFSEKVNEILKDKKDIISQIALSHFDERAWDDQVLQHVFGDVVREKSIALYRKFIEIGKLEGFISADIPTEAAITYVMESLSIFQHPDFLATPPDYKMGMMKLVLYGLLGREN
jgi:AcrR family transcriptional regulator